MTNAISIRLDEEAARALAQLQASGLTRSEAVRHALVETASRRRDRQAVAEEVADLEADEADRNEMRDIAALMESLRAPR